MFSQLAGAQPLCVQQHGAVTEVTLANDAKRNALNLAMVSGLTSIVLAPPTGTRSIVISGGTHFSAGADIAIYVRGDRREIEALTDSAARLCRAMTESPLPIIAAVEGVALGGGFEIALAADIVIASQTVTFGLPETCLGLIPGWGGTQRLTAQVGPRRAKQMIMLAERIDAATAVELGLANSVCPPGEARSRALAVAERLAEGSGSALAATKAMVELGQGPLALEAERAALAHLFASPDGIEGVHAFAQKRSPRFGSPATASALSDTPPPTTKA